MIFTTQHIQPSGTARNSCTRKRTLQAAFGSHEPMPHVRTESEHSRPHYIQAPEKKQAYALCTLPQQESSQSGAGQGCCSPALGHSKCTGQVGMRWCACHAKPRKGWGRKGRECSTSAWAGAPRHGRAKTGRQPPGSRSPCTQLWERDPGRSLRFKKRMRRREAPAMTGIHV